MNKRNWLDLSRKLVDRFDMDYTVDALQQAIGEASLSYFGEGVLITTTYPSPFPITLSGSNLNVTVGNGIAYDPNGQITRIDSSSTTQKFVTLVPHSTLPRWDLLVIRYKESGQTSIPKPSDPITNVSLNLVDDFELALVAGTPNASPVYPAKGALDIILAGIQIPAAIIHSNSATLDLSIREKASPDVVKLPVFIQEIPTGTVNSSNKAFTLSERPINNTSVLVTIDGTAQRIGTEWSIVDQVITFVSAPAFAQSVYVWYIADSGTTASDLSALQETPTPAANGTIDTFLLTGLAVNQDSTMVFVDGLQADKSTWDLINATTSSIKFHAGSIPAIGQEIYVFYLQNINGTGGGGGGGGGSGAYVVTGSTVGPLVIDPTAGVAVSTDPRQLRFVASMGGAVPVTANPQVGVGSTIGQELTLIGTSNTNYITLADGNGLSLNGTVELKNNMAIYLFWNGTVWSEISRR